jgi:hypothetical protein
VPLVLSFGNRKTTSLGARPGAVRLEKQAAPKAAKLCHFEPDLWRSDHKKYREVKDIYG